MPGRRVSDIISPREIKEIKELNFPLKPVFKPALKTAVKKPAKAVKTPIVTGVKPLLTKTKHPVKFKKALWWPTAIVLILGLTAGASYFLIKPKLTLEIWPKKTPLEVKTQLTVSTSRAGSGIIAGEAKIFDCPFSQEFPATGASSKSTKATGTIRVYNAYSTSPQVLIANTRFVSDGGKLFRTPQKVTIPGAHYEGSKLVPGEIDIVVEAGEPGEGYNIGSSTFSLPGLAGTSRYTAFYAKSANNMTGGSNSETMEVSQADLDNAEDVLTAKALNECKDLLKNSLILEEYIMIDEASKTEIIETTSPTMAGEEVGTFVMQVKARSTAVIFKKQDLKNAVTAYVSGQVSAGKTLDENSIAVAYSLKTADTDKGEVILDVNVSAETYTIPDENAVKEALKNKTSEEMAATLHTFQEIDKVNTKLQPFWLEKSPQDTGSMIITTRLD